MNICICIEPYMHIYRALHPNKRALNTNTYASSPKQFYP